MRFGGLQALRNVELALEPGEILGLIGPNGAGKTTLFNVLSGYVAPQEGTVRLDGQSITRTPPHRRTHLGLGRTFQIPRPFAGMTVFENLLTVAHYSTRNPEPEAAAEEVLAALNFIPIAARPVESLSVTERKRLELGRALAANPSYLLLDEVFAGLNPSEKERMRETVREVARARGLGVLLVEHDLKTVFTLSKRVMVLFFGEVLAQGTPGEVAENPEVIRAYIGEGAV